MNKENSRQLLQRYRLGMCTEEEKQVVHNWYESLYRKSDYNFSKTSKEKLKAEIWSNLEYEIDQDQLISPSWWKKYTSWSSIAAAAIVLIALSFYFINRETNPLNLKDSPIAVRYKNDIDPGIFSGDIYVDGKVLSQSSQLFRTLFKNGEQLLTITDSGAPHDIQLKTKRGENLQVQLPDGTRVWLNTESQLSLKLPFKNRKRKVNLEGEGYFEVAKDRGNSFLVESALSSITVLGTHFNVNSYSASAQKITLMEGKIAVQQRSHQKEPLLMTAGQQLQLDNKAMVLVKDYDAEKDRSWNQGYFTFDNVPMKEVLQTLASWYDLEIVYNDKIPQDYFYGQLDKSSKLASVLRILEKTGIKFLIDGHKVTVL